MILLIFVDDLVWVLEGWLVLMRHGRRGRGVDGRMVMWTRNVGDGVIW